MTGLPSVFGSGVFLCGVSAWSPEEAFAFRHKGPVQTAAIVEQVVSLQHSRDLDALRCFLRLECRRCDSSMQRTNAYRLRVVYLRVFSAVRSFTFSCLEESVRSAIEQSLTFQLVTTLARTQIDFSLLRTVFVD